MIQRERFCRCYNPYYEIDPKRKTYKEKTNAKDQTDDKWIDIQIMP